MSEDVGTFSRPFVGALAIPIHSSFGGLIAILPSAWRDWTGRVNVTFDFPRVTPDYGSLGQGDAWSNGLENVDP